MLHGAIGDAVRRRAPLVRGADVLRDADREFQPEGLSGEAGRSAPHGAPQAAPQDVPEDTEPREEAPRPLDARRGRSPDSIRSSSGSAIAALGVFLAAVLWLGFSGGPVADLVKSAIGAAAYVAPVVLVPLGTLIVTRSALVDVRPFRLGLPIAVVGLLLVLGSDHGGLGGSGSSGSLRSRSARPARRSSACC